MRVGLIVCCLSLFALGLSIIGLVIYQGGLLVLGLIGSAIGFCGGIGMMMEDRNEKRHI